MRLADARPMIVSQTEQRKVKRARKDLGTKQVSHLILDDGADVKAHDGAKESLKNLSQASKWTVGKWYVLTYYLNR